MQHSIRAIGQKDIEQAVSIMFLAFADDPFTRWMYPTSETYFKHFPTWIRTFCQLSFESGAAKMVDGHDAAALWMPPGIHPHPETLKILFERDVPADRRGDVERLFHELATFRPLEHHWYLAALGVDPISSGQGCASALIQQATSRSDQEGTSIFLESTNKDNLPFYERHGFRSVGVCEVERAPRLYPMLRRAKQIVS